MSGTIHYQKRGAVARITLDRPPLNVLTTAMMRDLGEAVTRAGADTEVRVVALDARGKAFCAGVDVADHVGDLVGPMMDALVDLFERLRAVPQPTVSVVQGAVLGGGCELALGTDLCLAADSAKFGQPEIKLGVFAPPASVLLPRIVGPRRAMEMLLTGATIDSAEARRVGLVNAVFPAGSFAEDADAWIDEHLLSHSGVALRLAKRAAYEQDGKSFDDAHRALIRFYLDELMASADAAEGLASFMEKRRPRWTHS